MRGRGGRGASTMTLVVAAVLTLVHPLASLAAATSSATSEGQVRAMVAAASGATTLSVGARRALLTATSDIHWYLQDRNGACEAAVSQCTLGPPNATKTVVLFGDSHANMWVPAVLPAVEAAGAKLVVLWLAMCPVANVEINSPYFGYPAKCDAFRSAAERLIVSLAPSAVIVAERTSGDPGFHGNYSSNYVWGKELERTIDTIAAPGRKIAIIQDTPLLPWSAPACLARNPTAVNACAVPLKTKAMARLDGGEVAAARATNATYISTIQYFCTSVCPMAIGPYVVYPDNGHVSASYATFLSGLIGRALRGVLR